MGRCQWAGSDPLYIDYHDHEWGVPEASGQALFEKLILEGFQAGLSWITILRKRENFRRAFAGFDAGAMLSFSAAQRAALMQDAGIVRNAKKIEAAFDNARAFMAMKEGGMCLSSLFWGAVDGKPVQNNYKHHADIPAKTPLSTALSKELKRLGFRFVGPTTVYAHCQAMGLVNDHVVDCPAHEVCARLGAEFDHRSSLKG